MSAWRESLRTATWRDLAFKVSTSDGIVGRRVHVHEYPFRDDPWAEDLGRRTRAFTVRGYLIGDDVADQLKAFEEAAEQSGSGELVHPFRETKTVTLLGCTSSDSWEEGRMVRLTLEFVETGERRYPSSETNSRSGVASAATRLDQVCAASGVQGVATTLKSGVAGTQSIVRTAQSYVSQARSLVSSATGAIRSVSAFAGLAIPGVSSLGRYLNAATSSTSVLGRVTSLSSGVTGALSRFNSARSAVTTLGSKVMFLANSL
ncbi:DNA circularization N-terminal domain-containing protein [Roseomonas chloroacetimidivorans]|uniref:DNA circularization N-terminal domain-containing protein n=1 Tax=Roseomonas chloroacetimidivorans TaxID=1766656 RepID=UPI003C780636